MKIRYYAFVLALVLFAATPVLAQQYTEPMGAAGYIDWVNMKVVSKGLGAAPPSASSAAQARILGLRAAKADARRNMLEVIKGVRIDSQTKVANYLVEDDHIASQVAGILQGATIEETGQDATGLYTATASLSLTGEMGRVFIQMIGKPATPRKIGIDELAPEVGKRIDNVEGQISALVQQLFAIQSIVTKQGELINGLEAQTKTLEARLEHIESGSKLQADKLNALEQEQQHRAAEMQALRNEIASQSGKLDDLQQQLAAPTRARIPGVDVPDYTGLVVDARGSGFTPCMRPELINRDSVIYPATTIDLQRAAAEGHARYMNSLASAQRMPRVGSMPYTIKISQTVSDKSGSLPLSDKDAAVLKGVLTQDGNFLDACKVVIVF